MDRPRAALGIATALIASLAVFQLALVLGAPWGRAAWGGGHEVLPPLLRAGSAFAILTYAAFVAILRRRLARPDSRFARVGAWLVVAYLALGVALNLASSSPWERFLMAPVALVLAASSAVVARSTPRAAGARP